MENKEDLKENEENVETKTTSTEEEINSQESDNQNDSADEVNEFEVKYNELNDKYLRLYSEFDNYKRRTSKEKEDIIKTAASSVIKDLLTVLDDFERAIKSNAEAEDVDGVKEGFNLIHHKLEKILESKGLTPMNSEGQEFDVEMHEALTNIPAPTDDLKGKVVEVVEKGYLLNDRVIRYAKVVVGN